MYNSTIPMYVYEPRYEPMSISIKKTKKIEQQFIFQMLVLPWYALVSFKNAVTALIFKTVQLKVCT